MIGCWWQNTHFKIEKVLMIVLLVLVDKSCQRKATLKVQYRPESIRLGFCFYSRLLLRKL